MGFSSKIRSCRYMPPENYARFGETHISPYYGRGARSYFDFGHRGTITSEITDSAEKAHHPGPLDCLKTLLSRFRFSRES